jgi:uncharacterized membrane protein
MLDLIRKLKKSSYFIIFAALTCLSTALILGRMFMTHSIRYGFLVWNIILAWVPYIISIYISRHKKPNGIVFWLGISMWLLFFPNAPYMLTDYIHVPNIKFGPDAEISLLAWFDVIVMSLFIWTGYLLGLESLKSVHKRLNETLGKVLSWIFIVIVSILSGYAIFIGRYARLNSWDVLRPFYLLSVFISWFNMTSVVFSIMFAFLILISYVIYKELSRS